MVGCSRGHLYRFLDTASPYFDAELLAIVHRRKSGSIYFLEDELVALLRSRCSAPAAADEAAA